MNTLLTSPLLEFFSKRFNKNFRKEWFAHKRSKGSHHLYENSDAGKTVVVPVHGNKDLPKGTYYAILKQAGIDKE